MSSTHKATALESVARYTFIAGNPCKTQSVPDMAVQMQDHSHNNQSTIIEFPIPLNICKLVAPWVDSLKTSERPSSSCSSDPFYPGAQTQVEKSSDLPREIWAWCSDIKQEGLY